MDDPQDITAWQRLDARTTTSGRLRAGDIAKLADAGVRHVINLAPDDRPGALEGEAALLAERGIRYTYIPVPFDAPADTHYEAFRSAYEADAEPVHVHCIMNYRVSAFFYRYNTQVRGLHPAEARAVMERQWKPEETENGAPWAEFIAASEG